MPKLKIAFLSTLSLTDLGGAEIFLYNILYRMSERGHDVHLHSSINYRKLVRGIELHLNLPFNTYPMPPARTVNWFPFVAKRYIRTMQAIQNYDVWIIVGAYPAAYVASSLAGVTPLVLRTHGSDIQIDDDLGYGTRRNPKVNQRTTYALNNMDRVIAMTKTIRQEYLRLGVPDSKVVDIPNGVDVARFQSGYDCRSVRKAHNIADNRVLILTVGRNEHRKGFDMIPVIARLLKQKGVNFDWRVVGTDTEELMPALREAGVSDSVHPMSPISYSWSSRTSQKFPEIPGDDLVALFRCADVFVFPSRIELFPQVIIQAMSANVPVVTTDAPGCRDVVEHGVNGLLAPPGNAAEFADHIVSVVKDHALRKHLISGGLRKARESDWSHVVSAYEDVCYQLVAETGIRL